MPPLVKEPDNIRIAMLGMVDGNGHPYSWSAIFNGYDHEKMQHCPYPVIADYLDAQPPDALGIPGARVTHIWTDNPADAEHVAAASLIPDTVKQPVDVIGHVDAVIIATDRGNEHVERCKPFIEEGIPVFIDKPLVDNPDDLAQFVAWKEDGKPFLSTSAMRYCKEFMPFRTSTTNLGELRFASITTPKTWERYGIHALEAIYPILGPGFLTCRNTGTIERNVVHYRHRRDCDVVVTASSDMYGGFGCLQLCGTRGNASAAMADTFHAFKSQLEVFVNYLRTGDSQVPFEETRELMLMLIAGIESRNNGGNEISLAKAR